MKGMSMLNACSFQWGIIEMDISSFSMKRKDARRLWKEYVAACKDNPKDKFLSDMKTVYGQLKSGRKIIDINKIFEASGVNEQFEPKLAIALAPNDTVFMEYQVSGSVVFRNRIGRSWKQSRDDIVILNIFPKLPPAQWEGNYSQYMRRQSPVPVIPASVRPKGNLVNYYILWEVEKWENVPPKDPYLLRRLTPNMFVVVAGWNLTELERAVMKGRMH